ncbi:hypothetical protein ABH944_009024 [Caballeronia udeis]|uniref:Uncharacterized protein n=1 Tax=Caballeronia udeis TaxID=1232866 RepID=A0ABW8MZ07_9BURK
MRFETIQYDNVPEDGQIDAGAVVPVDGKSWLSPPDGGCGIPPCPCFCGHFFMRLFPRDDQGVVFGYIAEFDTREELEDISGRWLASTSRR